MIEDDRALAKMAESKTVSTATLKSEAQAAIRRHPSDYYAFALVAFRLVADKDPEAGRWLNRALLAAPNDSRLHVAAARLLLQRGYHSQAALEYKLAYQQAHESRLTVMYELVGQLKDPALVLRALPDDSLAFDMAAGTFEQKGRMDAALVISGEAARRNPEDLRALARLASKTKDPVARLKWSEARARVSGDEEGGRLYAAALIEQKRFDEAVQVLQRIRRTQARPSPEVAILLAEALAYDQKVEESRKVLGELTAGPDMVVRARAHRAMADIEERLGNSERALNERQRARALPGGP
jgi:lipopolysaccharide biosynthesis regulator YciM